jgi:cyclopropane-fatty-acyl-phospholipid synthase
MDRLLQSILASLFTVGTLHVTTASGRKFTVGDGTGTPVAIRFATRLAELRIVLDPELKLGEAYMNGTFVVEQGSIAEFLDALLANLRTRRMRWLRFVRFLRACLRALWADNTLRRARRNVSHHYDLDRRLYTLFLDADMQYSCAYFEKHSYSIDKAQAAKKQHLARKLLVERHHRVLDIGSGWGGLSLFLAQTFGAEVTGITLSQEQLAASSERARTSGLASRVEFRLQDYRDVEGSFDRIVSVGMFEHVGTRYYQTFFRKCFELLRDDGVMLLHTVGRLDGAADTNAWISRYIFPGGHAPALSEIIPAIEDSGFMLSDVEVLRLHYAETLRRWRRRFLANRIRVTTIYDERFLRMWEYYLAAFEAAFRHYGLVVFQLQLIKDIHAVPITRDYMYRRDDEPDVPLATAAE